MQLQPFTQAQISCRGSKASCSTRQPSIAAPLAARQAARSRRHKVPTTCCTPSSTATPVAERLTGSDLQQWQECSSLLEARGVPPDAADSALAKAFGWKGQAYWRKSLVQAVPSVQQVSAVLAFLEGLGIRDADLVKVLAAFPEVLGCDSDAQLASNVAVLEKTWKIKGPVLTKTLLRRPDVLGYNVDCEGNCVGECNRCWVRF